MLGRAYRNWLWAAELPKNRLVVEADGLAIKVFPRSWCVWEEGVFSDFAFITRPYGMCTYCCLLLNAKYLS